MLRFASGGMATSERLDTATFDLSSCLHNSHPVNSGGLLHTQAPTICLQPNPLPFLLPGSGQGRPCLPARNGQACKRAQAPSQDGQQQADRGRGTVPRGEDSGGCTGMGRGEGG